MPLINAEQPTSEVVISELQGKITDYRLSRAVMLCCAAAKVYGLPVGALRQMCRSLRLSRCETTTALLQPHMPLW